MPPEGSLVQRSFAGGELTPAAWGRADIPNYQHGLKTARNGYIMRQGGFTNRPGTAMVATVANSMAGKVRLIPFVFGVNVSFVLEFGDKYMRVYQDGAQVQVTPGNAYQIVSPYAIADLPNLQFVQISNVLYFACKGYPVYKLTSGGAQNWAFNQMNFVPATPSPGNGAGPTFADNGGHLWYGTTFGYVGFTYPETNPGHWDTPWNELGVGQALVPGSNGYPSIASGLFEQNYYMVTAVNTNTGVESYPIAGTVSGWKCASHNTVTWGGPAASPETGDTIERVNAVNAQAITGFTAAFPLVVNVADTTNFQGITNPLFVFSGTGTELDGFTSYGAVSAGQIVFGGIDAEGFPASFPPGATVTCLASVVISVPQAPQNEFTESGDIINPGQSVVIGQGTILYSPTQQSFIVPIGQNGWEALALAFLESCFVKCPLNLSWAAPAVAGNYIYNIYKQDINGDWGFLGTADGLSFQDIGDVPDVSKAPPTYTQIGAGIIGDPSVIGVYQQRLLLGNTPQKPDYVFASNTGEFNEFTLTQPVPVDSDTVQFEVVGEQYNPITQFTDNGFLLIFTQTGEFSCYGAGSAFSPGPITPTEVGLVQQAFYGSTPLLKPLSIGKNVLYMQILGSQVRELLYNYYINGYSGSDLTVYSNHLFDGFTFVDWAYQQQPNSLVHLVRDDGTLLTLTYLPELQLVAWTRNDTNGLFENVCAVPEGSETALYCVVNRNGTRFIERFASRTIPMIPTQAEITQGENIGKIRTVLAPDPTAFVFMDCSSFYDGRNAPITLDGQTGLCSLAMTGGDYTAHGNGFTLEATPVKDIFPGPGAVGQAWILTDPATGFTYKCVIIDASGAPVSYLVRPIQDIPASFQGQSTTVFSLGVNQLTGLDYLNGYEVSILADGAVVSSPSSEAMVEVQNGVVPLNSYYGYVRVGLPYFTDVRGLDIDTPQPGQTSQDKPQLTNRVGLRLQSTRGLWAGSQPPLDDAIDPFENLERIRARTDESLGQVPRAETSIALVAVDAKWLYGGGVFIRQPEPLPMSLLSVIPAGKWMLGG